MEQNSPITGEQFPSSYRSSLEGITTFRSNYQPPPKHFTAAQKVEPLPPASVIHKNACFSQIEGSLSQNAYKFPHPSEVHQVVPSAASMYATNFKMDADRRLETHYTTHRDGYRPASMDSLQNKWPRGGKLSNPGPLGNKVYGCPVGSEYFMAFNEAQFVVPQPLGRVRATGDKERHNTITGMLYTKLPSCICSMA